MTTEEENSADRKAYPVLLIVEDDPTTSNVCQPVAESVGLRVLQAETTEQALEQMETQQVDLVLADLRIPTVGGMVLLRHVAYVIEGGRYVFGDLPGELFYEYLKDFRAYWGFVALIYLYRHILLRLQGEAQFLTEGKEDSLQSAQPVTDRFLVKKLGREFLVKVDHIDWIEASGNYVNLHVGERLYPLRETMAGIQQRLVGQGFARVHRSAIVNLDRVREIEPFDTGDARAHLLGGGVVPVSRRYRQALKERLA